MIVELQSVVHDTRGLLAVASAFSGRYIPTILLETGTVNATSNHAPHRSLSDQRHLKGCWGLERLLGKKESMSKAKGLTWSNPTPLLSVIRDRRNRH